MARPITYLNGMIFGDLEVIEVSDRDKWNNMMYNCKCKCGNYKVIRASDLTRGHTTSCGCKISKANKSRSTHNKTNTRLYRIWAGMKTRCHNDNDKGYINYGGRGIKICNEWSDDFEKFYSWAITHGYKSNLSIDRINNDGNYEPNNCRWVTSEVQGNNKSNNKYITYNGQTKSIMDWAEIIKIPYPTLWNRLYKYNWTIEQALTIKLNGRRRV